MTQTGTGDRQLVRSSALVGLGTALSRVTGMLRVLVIARIGIQLLTDNYNAANNTPNILYELLLGGILTATLVPLFVEYTEQGDERGPAAINTVAVAVLAVTAFVGIVLAPMIMRPYFLGVHRATRESEIRLAATFLRFFMPQVFFYGLFALITAILNAHRRFVAAAFAPVLNNVVVIAIFLAIPEIHPGRLDVATVQDSLGLRLLMGLGTTAGIVAMTLALFPALHRAGLRFRLTRHWRHPAVRKLVRLSGWTIGYVVANQIAFWVANFLALRHASDLTVYLVAFTFFQLPHGLFAVSIMTTITPELAACDLGGDTVGFRRHFSLGLRLLGLVIIPATVITLVMSRPIVNAFVWHGRVTGHDAAVVAQTLVAFGTGLVFFSVYLYTLRAFYAQRDTRTPFVVNCLENGVNIVAAFALYPLLGVQGLALAWSIAYAVASVVAVAALRRRIGSLDGTTIVRSFSKMTLAAAALAVVAWVAVERIGYGTPARGLAATVVGLTAGAAVYVAVLWLLHVGELRLLVGSFVRRKVEPPPPGV
ncbi:MAG: murein biosynthesis integral membrane protein MurJ [Acidimicrobiia bacterium]